MSQTEVILVDAAVEINNQPVTIEGNTISFVEGQGTSSVKAATRAGATVMVASQDVTTRVAMIKFEMPASIQSTEQSRLFKALGVGLLVRISGQDSQGNIFARTMRSGVMTNDPEKAIQNEGKIPIEISGCPLV